MKKIEITDVFFDLDHTLWDFDKNSALAFKRVFAKNNITLDLNSFLKQYEPINFEYWAAFREERVTKTQLRRGRFIDSFKKCNMTYPLDVIDKLSDDYIDELPGNNHLLPGAMEILEYLHPKYNLHIITNGFREVQHIKLKKSDIHHFFNTVTSSEEVGVKKPNAKVFYTALEKAKVEASKAMMIGDTYAADIEGALAVAMDVIFYNYRKDVITSPIKIIDHLIEIKNFL